MTQSAVVTSKFDGLLSLFVLLTSMYACTDYSRPDSQTDVHDQNRVKSSCFVGNDNAWLVTANEGNLLLTTNAGRDWSTVPGDVVGGKFDSVGFANDVHGLAVNSHGQIWKSVDGGQTWTRIAQLETGKPRDWQFMSSHEIHFADALRAWIVETFTIWRTDDGGETWHQIYSVLDPTAEGQPGTLHFLDRNTGWLVTSKGRVFQTVDGGNHWGAISLEKKVSAKDVFFINQKTGWILAFSGIPPYSKMYRSEDTGKTWLEFPIPDPKAIIYSVSIANEQEGWVAGRVWTGDPNTSSAVVLRTVDAGQSWHRIDVRQPEPFFYYVQFLDSQHGWLLGQNNIYRTDDSGKNWRSVLQLPPKTNADDNVRK